MNYVLYMLLLASTTAFAGYDWNRYEVIIQRAPFGQEPPPEESAAPARPAGEFAKQYRLCMLYEDAQGQLKAGLVSKVNNKNFFLKVGEIEKGLGLVAVRLEEGVAVLQQGDETAHLILEGLAAPSVQKFPGAPSAMASRGPETATLQWIHRAGTESTPEHIRAGLANSAPKQPGLTVRETHPAASGETGSGDENRPSSAVVFAPASAPATYLVQSVPPRHNPFQ